MERGDTDIGRDDADPHRDARPIEPAQSGITPREMNSEIQRRTAHDRLPAHRHAQTSDRARADELRDRVTDRFLDHETCGEAVGRGHEQKAAGLIFVGKMHGVGRDPDRMLTREVPRAAPGEGISGAAMGPCGQRQAFRVEGLALELGHSRDVPCADGVADQYSTASMTAPIRASIARSPQPQVTLTLNRSASGRTALQVGRPMRSRPVMSASRVMPMSSTA